MQSYEKEMTCLSFSGTFFEESCPPFRTQVQVFLNQASPAWLCGMKRNENHLEPVGRLAEHREEVPARFVEKGFKKLMMAENIRNNQVLLALLR